MDYMFWLYLFSRLDSFKWLIGFSVFALGIGYVVALIAGAMKRDFAWTEGEKAAAKNFLDVVWGCKRRVIGAGFGLMLLNSLLPSQKDAVFIVAGTGVIEAARSDAVQRVAGKAAAVVEKVMDDYLNEPKKK